MPSNNIGDLLAKRQTLEQALASVTESARPPEALPHELEEQRKLQLLSRVREARARLLINKGVVKCGDPSKVYVWVNQREERRVYFEGLGYTRCTDPKVETQWKRADGGHQRGDLVLYEVDKELHEALKLDSEIRAIEQMAGSKNAFQEFAVGANIKTFQAGG